MAFLFLDGVIRTAFLAVAIETRQPPCLPPVAPLVAGLPLLAIHFWAHSGLATLAAVMRYTPAGLVLPIQEAVTSDAFLLIGGALTLSALAPWRWRAGPPAPPWANWHAVGVIAGMAAIPALRLVLQLSEGAASNIGPPGIVRSDSEFLLVMVGGAQPDADTPGRKMHNDGIAHGAGQREQTSRSLARLEAANGTNSPERRASL